MQERYGFIVDLARYANSKAKVTLNVGELIELKWDWNDLTYEFPLLKHRIFDDGYVMETLFECARCMSKRDLLDIVQDQKDILAVVRKAFSVPQNVTVDTISAADEALAAVDSLCDDLFAYAE